MVRAMTEAATDSTEEVGGGSWDDAAENWDSHVATRAYAAAAFDSLVTVLADRQLSIAGAVVCDFGCGTGLLIEHLVADARSVDAVDISPAMLAQVWAKIDKNGWTNVHPALTVPVKPRRMIL